MNFLPLFSIKHPKRVVAAAAAVSVIILLLSILPSLFPTAFPFLHPLKVDTDPENMLAGDEPVRVHHNELKRQFSLYDVLVVGVVDERGKNGVFRPDTLKEIYELADFAGKIKWQGQDGREQGVIDAEIMAPSTVDNIEQGGPGTVRFEWLMESPPKSKKEALDVRAKAKRLPMLDGTLVSDDGTAVALYIPITSKSVSYKVAEKLREKITEFKSGAKYYITGLPVAQDTFGVEMFVQMAISAPLAMLLIFILMLLFFKNVWLVISPLIVAVLSVIFTMGLLVITGNTVHIMSSMIPIFIMPIAVLDAIHILSDFFDRYNKNADRREIIGEVMHELGAPMLYTSLTTFAGFFSLALTPIPPVRVFGIFVGTGVLAAWLFTVTLIPAYIMLIKEDSLEGIWRTKESSAADVSGGTLLSQTLHRLGELSFRYAKGIIALTLILAGISYYGITRININDNPVKWFSKSHEIRISDRELNKRFAGTYMAYLALKSGEKKQSSGEFAAVLRKKMQDSNSPALKELSSNIDLEKVSPKKELLSLLQNIISKKLDTVSDDKWDDWDAASLYLDKIEKEGEIFKDPAVLKYMEDLQHYLFNTGLVGKSSSLSDIVKTVHRELFLGKESEFIIPESREAVAQTLLSFQGSHRPNDLWHFVSPDYTAANIWLQLKSGDNRDMNRVVDKVERYLAENPPPVPLKHTWFGLTYINVVWQKKMVKGMLEAFTGSFVVVLALMVVLFRSFLWGLLSMVPLTATIGAIYGLIGFLGKDYDMPIAVLSSLSLGLAVDYAIHFLARSRHLSRRYGSWKDTVKGVFGEPARAITRNVIVVSFGFLPLIAAPLVPYKTVGFFISAILLLAGAATLVLLPALIRIFERYLFKQWECKKS